MIGKRIVACAVQRPPFKHRLREVLIALPFYVGITWLLALQLRLPFAPAVIGGAIGLLISQLRPTIRLRCAE